jgi:putative mycofactocin binding protein MftB
LILRAGTGGDILTEDACYHLSPGVRVRREAFGLLFYNSRDTKLTFVKSGDLLDIETLSPGSRGLTIHSDISEGEAKVMRLLETLRKKGLIIEA